MTSHRTEIVWEMTVVVWSRKEREAKTVSWTEFRTKRHVDAVLAEHVEAGERTYRLREIRDEGSVIQNDLAVRMALTQPTVSALKPCNLDQAGQPHALCRSPVGTVESTATFVTGKLALSPRT